MTPTEQKAFDDMRETFKPFEKLFKQMTDVHPTPTNFDCQIAVRDLRALIYSFDDLTAANAVSEQQGEAKTYAPSRQRVVMACDILDRIKEAHENWGGWSGTPSSCDAAINLLRYPANMPVNAAHPQATEPAGKTRDPLDLGQYVNEANISANDKPVAVIEKLQAVINVKKGFQ